MTGRLARRYARALLALAREQGDIEGVGTELGVMATAFADPRLHAVLASPMLHASERLRVSSQVVGALGVSANVVNLLRLLAQRERLNLIPDLVRVYEELVDRELGRLRIVVRSAVALGAAEQERVLDLARRLTNQREIIAGMIVDPELLGGVMIDIRGTVYDGTIRTQLERLSREMAVQQ